jgi:hypothetical protein
MLFVRRLIETPACRQFVKIDIRDFMMEERELAAKYGVPWQSNDAVKGLAVLAVGAMLAGLCLFTAFAHKVA